MAEATASFGDASMAREVPHPFVSPSNSPAVVQVLEAAILFPQRSVQCVHLYMRCLQGCVDRQALT